jgi:hypothetical protein
MLRPSLLALACLAVSATAVYPQAPGEPLVQTPPSQLEQIGLTPPTVLSEGFASDGEDTLVTQLLGQIVFSSINEDAQEIGEITNMVVTSGQGISAVVLSVGGFLGVGSKEVAVDFNQLQWLALPDGSRRWVLSATAEQLTAAPAFIWSDSETVTGEPAMTPAQEAEQLADDTLTSTPIDPALTTDATERPVIEPPATPVVRDGFTAFDETGLTPEDFRGIAVFGVNDEQIGTIGDILLTPDGAFDAVIVDVGGFLGIGAKPVAVAFENLTFSADTAGNRYLFLNTSREQLEAQSAYDAATYAAQRDGQRMVIAP